MDEHRVKLAIVIPAFKASYLERTLSSVVSQSDQRFALYIGDDASPEPIEDVVRQFASTRPIVYQRFQQNVGRHSLTKHWQRCIAMSSEPWIWLFSDDDLMEPECVSAFYRTLADTNGHYDVYRYDTIVIDGLDRVQSLNPPHPQVESALHFAYFLLMDRRLSYVQEAIVSRAALERAGGFVEFPLAWSSDWATQILLGHDRGICKINGPLVRFRMSGVNISSAFSRRIMKEKMKANMMFISWLMQLVEGNDLKEDVIGIEQMRQESMRWFIRVTVNRDMLYAPSDCIHIVRFAHRMWGLGRLHTLARVVKFNVHTLLDRL